MNAILLMCLLSANPTTIDITGFTRIENNRVVVPDKNGGEKSFDLASLSLEDRLVATSVGFLLLTSKKSEKTPNTATSQLEGKGRREELVKFYHGKRVLLQYPISDLELLKGKLKMEVTVNTYYIHRLTVDLPQSDLDLIDKHSIFTCTGTLVFAEKSPILNGDWVIEESDTRTKPKGKSANNNHLVRGISLRAPMYAIETDKKTIKLTKALKKSAEEYKLQDTITVSQKIQNEFNRIKELK